MRVALHSDMDLLLVVFWGDAALRSHGPPGRDPVPFNFIGPPSNEIVVGTLEMC